MKKIPRKNKNPGKFEDTPFSIFSTKNHEKDRVQIILEVNDFVFFMGHILPGESIKVKSYRTQEKPTQKNKKII